MQMPKIGLDLSRAMIMLSASLDTSGTESGGGENSLVSVIQILIPLTNKACQGRGQSHNHDDDDDRRSRVARLWRM